METIGFKILEEYDDNDKLIVSVSSLRKMLGNGWTINVIKHILKNLKI